MEDMRFKIKPSSPNIEGCGYKIFKENEMHTTRYPSHHTMIFMISGVLNFCENDVDVSLSKGEFYLQGKEKRQHARIPSSKAEYYYIHFYGDVCDDNESGIIIPTRCNYEKELIIPKLDKLFNNSKILPFSFLDTQILFLEIIGLLSGSRDYNQNAVDVTIAYLHNHYSEKVNYDVLCDTFGYSQSYLKKTFKNATGVSPHTYLLNIRLNSACKLIIDTNLSLADISQKIGFADFPSFYRAFKKQYSIGPNEYRNDYLKKIANS